MTVGDLAVATASLGSGGTFNFTPGDFTTTDGTSLTDSAAVLARSIAHPDDIDVNRTGDPDDDGTFEINVTVESRTGADEAASESYLLTGQAGIEVSEQASTTQDIIVVAEQYRTGNVWVEQNDGVANTNEIARTVASRNSEETVIEAVRSAGSVNLARRADTDDDGTFEEDFTATTYGSAGVDTGLASYMVDHNSSNPMMEIALVNQSGGQADLMLLGTVA